MHVAVTQFNTGTAAGGCVGGGGGVLGSLARANTNNTHQQGRTFQLRLLKRGIQSAARYVYVTLKRCKSPLRAGTVTRPDLPQA